MKLRPSEGTKSLMVKLSNSHKSASQEETLESNKHRRVVKISHLLASSNRNKTTVRSSNKTQGNRSRTRMTMIVIFEIQSLLSKDTIWILNAKSMLIPFATYIDVVHVWSFLLVRGNRNGGGNRRFGHLLHFYTPFVLWFLQICQSELRLSIRDSHINSILA